MSATRLHFYCVVVFKVTCGVWSCRPPGAFYTSHTACNVVMANKLNLNLS